MESPASRGCGRCSARSVVLGRSSYGHDGQACSNWSLTYTMLNQDGSWLIDRAVPDPGSPSPC